MGKKSSAHQRFDFQWNKCIFCKRGGWVGGGAVPVARELTDRISSSMAEHAGMLVEEQQHDTLRTILRHAAALQGNARVPVQDSLVVMEQEQEQVS